MNGIEILDSFLSNYCYDFLLLKYHNRCTLVLVDNSYKFKMDFPLHVGKNKLLTSIYANPLQKCLCLSVLFSLKGIRLQRISLISEESGWRD